MYSSNGYSRTVYTLRVCCTCYCKYLLRGPLQVETESRLSLRQIYQHAVSKPCNLHTVREELYPIQDSLCCDIASLGSADGPCIVCTLDTVLKGTVYNIHLLLDLVHV